MKQSRTVVSLRQDDAPSARRRLPLLDLLVDTRMELIELAVRLGLKVLDAMLEEDRCQRRVVLSPNAVRMSFDHRPGCPLIADGLSRDRRCPCFSITDAEVH